MDATRCTLGCQSFAVAVPGEPALSAEQRGSEGTPHGHIMFDRSRRWRWRVAVANVDSHLFDCKACAEQRRAHKAVHRRIAGDYGTALNVVLVEKVQGDLPCRVHVASERAQRVHSIGALSQPLNDEWIHLSTPPQQDNQLAAKSAIACPAGRQLHNMRRLACVKEQRVWARGRRRGLSAHLCRGGTRVEMIDALPVQCLRGAGAGITAQPFHHLAQSICKNVRIRITVDRRPVQLWHLVAKCALHSVLDLGVIKRAPFPGGRGAVPEQVLWNGVPSVAGVHQAEPQIPVLHALLERLVEEAHCTGSTHAEGSVYCQMVLVEVEFPILKSMRPQKADVAKPNRPGVHHVSGGGSGKQRLHVGGELWRDHVVRVQKHCCGASAAMERDISRTGEALWSRVVQHLDAQRRGGLSGSFDGLLEDTGVLW
mmetsp:Transcript_23228/g.74791  ORF Transcript_23228/g.74791 Transcript_23228/m.74791 type:complete len:426 (+) Transcript_23228:882-2159(+)